MKIALIGNPNSGKTTIFNRVTGSTAYVGNWPGVTVEKKTGELKGRPDILLVDLPGIYSMSPYSPEEVVTRDFLMNEKPDLIINVVDASNIERNLYLTTQLLDTGIPILMALNMMDTLRAHGSTIDVGQLSTLLGCPIIETSASRNEGITELIDCAQRQDLFSNQTAPVVFQGSVLSALERIEAFAKPEHGHERYWAVKIFEQDAPVLASLDLSEASLEEINNLRLACEQEYGDDAESVIVNQRYAYVEKLVSRVLVRELGRVSTSEKIDRILTNRYLALPLFALIMWGIYYVAVSSLGALLTDYVNDVLFGTYLVDGVTSGLESIDAAPWLSGLIIDGMIGGVGAILGFVPQLAILFFFLALLEDSGYMARVAFILDRLFRKFGLSGTSFIPILISSGCGVPGIMASRTIENDQERKITIMVTTFVPCGAKIPIIALIAGAFFPDSSLVAPSIYFLSIGMIALSGVILKKMSFFSGAPSPFLMELPNYHVPSMFNTLKYMWIRIRSFIIKAGTVIFVACGLIWFLSHFDFSLDMVETSQSMLAILGGFIAPVFEPLGFGSWQASVATLTGLVAKENVVATLGVLLGISSIEEIPSSLLAQMSLLFTDVGAYAFLVFNMLCAPCFAAIGAIRREMGSLQWTLIAVAYQTSLAYIAAFVVFQLGVVWLDGARWNVGTILAVLLVGFVCWLTFRRGKSLPSPTSQSKF